MAIALSCTCGKRLRLKDELAGKRVRCPGCQRPLTVPAPENEVTDEIDDSPPPEEKRRPKTKKKAKPAKVSGVMIASIIGGGVLILIAGSVGGYFFLRQPTPVAQAKGPEPKGTSVNIPIAPPPSEPKEAPRQAPEPVKAEVPETKTESPNAPPAKTEAPSPETKDEPKKDEPKKDEPIAIDDLPREGPGDPTISYEDVRKDPGSFRGKRVTWKALPVAGESSATTNRVMCAINPEINDFLLYRMFNVDVASGAMIPRLLGAGATKVTGTIAGNVAVTYDVNGPGGVGKEKRSESIPLLVFATFGEPVAAVVPPAKIPEPIGPKDEPPVRQKKLLAALRLLGELGGVRSFKFNFDANAGVPPDKILANTNAVEALLTQDRGNLEKRFPLFARKVADTPGFKSFHIAVPPKTIVMLAQIEAVLGKADRISEMPSSVSVPLRGNALVTYHYYDWCGFGVADDGQIIALTADLAFLRKK